MVARACLFDRVQHQVERDRLLVEQNELLPGGEFIGHDGEQLPRRRSGRMQQPVRVRRTRNAGFEPGLKELDEPAASGAGEQSATIRTVGSHRALFEVGSRVVQVSGAGDWVGFVVQGCGEVDEVIAVALDLGYRMEPRSAERTRYRDQLACLVVEPLPGSIASTRLRRRTLHPCWGAGRRG